jgi:dTDP-4-amino-4,6-dideoxygalactose transaminase
VPANTFVATAEAVCAAGARPVFVDVLPDTLQIDPLAVAAAVTPATAAIMAVHLFGQMADLDALAAVAGRHGIALIEDAAQAHGARFAGRRAGSVGVAAGFSFYPGKNLGALGDGGAVVTSDAVLAARVRGLANHGRAAADRHRHDARGRNSRLDTLQAAVLSAKLPLLDEHNAGRAAAMQRYRMALPDGCRPLSAHPAARPVHHLAVVEVDDRPRVMSALGASGIGWGIHYPVPCHRQPAFAHLAGEPLPVAERASEGILSLPMWPSITDAEVSRVCEVLWEAVA